MKTILLLLTVLALPAMGRIGMTMQECQNLYGEPIKTSGFKVCYQKGGVEIDCWFEGERCVVVSYVLAVPSRVIFEDIEKRNRFTTEQESRLLNFNRAGSVWEKVKKESYGREQDGVYKTQDGKLQALVNFACVSIETVEGYNARKADTEKPAVDKVVASFGSDAGIEPRLILKELPPNEEELRMKELQEATDNLKKSLEEQRELQELVDKIEGKK